MISIKNIFSSCIVSIALFCIISCKKSPIQTAPETNFAFVNTLNESVNVVIYKTPNDYNNNTNVLMQGVAAANGTYVAEKLKVDTTYYVDWYTNDFSYNNWYNQSGSIDSYLTTVFMPNISGGSMQLKQSYGPDLSRLVCLDGNGTQSTWMATGAFQGSALDTNYWYTLPPNKQYINIVFKKNFSVLFSFKDGNGNIIVDSLSLGGMTHGDSLQQFSANFQQNGGLFGMDVFSYYFYPLPVTLSKDKILLNADTGTLYILSRQ